MPRTAHLSQYSILSLLILSRSSSHLNTIVPSPPIGSFLTAPSTYGTPAFCSSSGTTISSAPQSHTNTVYSHSTALSACLRSRRRASANVPCVTAINGSLSPNLCTTNDQRGPFGFGKGLDQNKPVAVHAAPSTEMQSSSTAEDRGGGWVAGGSSVFRCPRSGQREWRMPVGSKLWLL